LLISTKLELLSYIDQSEAALLSRRTAHTARKEKERNDVTRFAQDSKKGKVQLKRR
jgi:hypothetical protein